jgi:hypothetical protein
MHAVGALVLMETLQMLEAHGLHLLDRQANILKAAN